MAKVFENDGSLEEAAQSDQTTVPVELGAQLFSRKPQRKGIAKHMKPLIYVRETERDRGAPPKFEDHHFCSASVQGLPTIASALALDLPGTSRLEHEVYSASVHFEVL